MIKRKCFNCSNIKLELLVNNNKKNKSVVKPQIPYLLFETEQEIKYFNFYECLKCGGLSCYRINKSSEIND